MQMKLTLSAAGSRDRANLGPVPGSEEAVQMTVISGLKCSALLKLSGQTGSLARMSEALFRWKWASTAAFLTWKISPMPSKHLLSVLSVSVPRTDVIDAGLWQTPNANEDRAECYTLETSYRHAQEGRQIHLAQEVRDSRLWPTPRAADGEKGTRTPEGHQKERERRGNGVDLPTAVMYPTARAKNLCGGAGSFEQLNKLKDAGQITEPERKAMAGGGSLNPNFVEYLMGFPKSWTEAD